MIYGKIIREVEDCPACFNKLNLDEYNYRFLDCLYKGDIFGNVAFLITNKECLFHVEINKWAYGTAKAFKTGALDEFFPYIKQLGVTKLVAIKDGHDDKKWSKFVAMLGFGEPINVMYTERRI